MAVFQPPRSIASVSDKPACIMRVAAVLRVLWNLRPAIRRSPRPCRGSIPAALVMLDVAASSTSKGSERVAAASWLGKSKKLNLFASHNAVTLYSLQVPAEFTDRYITTPVLEAEEYRLPWRKMVTY